MGVTGERKNIMAIIKYVVDGKALDIEVSDSFAKTFNEINFEDRKAEERYKWEQRKRLSSLDSIIDMGGQIEDPNSQFDEEIDQYDELYKAISKLLPEQQELIKQIYFLGKSQADVAKELKVCKQAINNRLLRTLEKLKNILR